MKLSIGWKIAFSNHTDLMKVFEDLHTLTTILIGSTKGLVWRDLTFVGVKVNPVIQKLLLLSQASDEQLPGATIREICRLGALLYLARIRVKFNCEPLLIRYRLDKLKETLSRWSADWTSVKEVLLWVLVIGGISSLEEADRRWFTNFIAQVMIELGLSSWDDVRLALSMQWNPWLIFPTECESLQNDTIEPLSKLLGFQIRTDALVVNV